MKRWFSLMLFLASILPLSCWGQTQCFQAGSNAQMCINYTPTLDLINSDNMPNAVTHNVWHHMLNTPQHAGKVVSGYDANEVIHHYMLTTVGGNIYEWNDYWSPNSPNTWTAHTEMGTAALAIAVGPTIYSQQDTSYCDTHYGGQGLYQVFKWTGSAWTAANGTSCVKDLKEASDGTLSALEQNGVPIYSTNGGVNWTVSHYTGSGTYQVGDVALQNATYGCIALASPPNGNNLVECGNPQSTAGFNSGFSNVAGLQVTVDNRGTLWIVNNQNAIEHWKGVCYTSNACFDVTQGSGFTAIDSCGPNCTFTIDTTGNLYMFPSTALAFTMNIYGNTTCYDGFGAVIPCPTGILHHGIAGAKWASQSLGGQTITGPSNKPETLINVTAKDTTLDPFICYDDNFQDCLTTPSGGSVQCSVVGAIFTASILNSILQTEMSRTRYKWDGNRNGTSCFTYGVGLDCVYQAQSWCTAGTTPPDNRQTQTFEVKAIIDSEGQPPYPTWFGWDISSLCHRWNIVGFHTPWECDDNTKPALVGNVGLAYGGPLGTDPATCTKSNP